MAEESVLKNRWVRAILLLAALAGVVFLAWLLRPVLVPLFFAFTAAYVLDPVVDFFEKRRISRMATIVVLAFLGLGLLLAIPLYVLPSVINESEELITMAQSRMEKVEGQQAQSLLNEWLHKLPLNDLVDALGWAPPPPEGVTEPPPYDPLAVILEQIGIRIQENAVEFVRTYGQRLLEVGSGAGATVAGVFASAGRAIMGTFLAIGSFALFAFVAGYLLRDYDHIIATARELIPPARRPRVGSIMSKIDGQLRGFMRGQALVCVFLGTMYSIGLVIAGVPFGLVLGVLGGLASFVPYMGLVVSFIPAVILCIVQQGGFDWHLAVVVGTFAVAQFLEGTVVTPKVVGDQVGLSPVWVILAVMVFGNALGLLGLLMAVPAAATLKVLIGETIDEYKRTEFFTSSSGV